MMKIPEKFTINLQEIKIVLVDTIEDRLFGQYDCIKDTIKLAKYIKDDEGEKIKLTEEQMLNTFFHEMLHAFQWHAKGDTSESESSTYAGYLVEFIKSSGININ